MRQAPSSDPTAKQGRLVALVIAGAMLLWLGIQLFGDDLGIPVRYLFLIDLAALGAFAWALIVSIGIWRRQNRDKE